MTQDRRVHRLRPQLLLGIGCALLAFLLNPWTLESYVVLDGHLECTSVGLKKKPGVDELTAALAEFRGRPQELKLPSAPDPLIVVRPEEDRPQPRFDRDHGAGMSVTVGRIRPCSVLDFKLLILSHNTVRGAAGASILNAEFLKAEGYF